MRERRPFGFAAAYTSSQVLASTDIGFNVGLRGFSASTEQKDMSDYGENS